MNDEEFFNGLYLARRDADVNYIVAMMNNTAPNKPWLGLTAAEIYDEVMAKYYDDHEHLNRDADHPRHIRRRIQSRLIDIIRKETAQKRRPPPATISLDAPRPAEDERPTASDDPVDPRSAAAEFDIDLDDAVSRLSSRHQPVVRARLEGKTHKQIATELDISEQSVRNRLQEARPELLDDP